MYKPPRQRYTLEFGQEVVRQVVPCDIRCRE